LDLPEGSEITGLVEMDDKELARGAQHWTAELDRITDESRGVHGGSPVAADESSAVALDIVNLCAAEVERRREVHGQLRGLLGQ
jgi:hypothetical protein